MAIAVNVIIITIIALRFFLRDHDYSKLLRSSQWRPFGVRHQIKTVAQGMPIIKRKTIVPIFYSFPFLLSFSFNSVTPMKNKRAATTRLSR